MLFSLPPLRLCVEKPHITDNASTFTPTPFGTATPFIASSSIADRLPLLEKYAPGTEQRCRVDPANDGTAYLRVKRPGDKPTKSGSV